MPSAVVLRLRAENPGPLTLSGTNTWIVGRDPAYVVDPGPALEEHLIALCRDRCPRRSRRHRAHSRSRRSLRGGRRIARAALRRRWPPGGGGRRELVDGTRFGPFEALSTPGHAPDHFALICEPGVLHWRRGARRGQRVHRPRSRCARRLSRAACRGCASVTWTSCAQVMDPRSGSLARSSMQYIEHRLERERLLLAALAAGRRSTPSCSTPPGRTSPPSCVPSPRSRCAPISTSSRTRVACPPMWSVPW